MSLTSGPTNEMPRVQVLAGFGATSASFPWTDISQYVRSGQITRSSNRLAGPLYQYQAGTCTLVLKNGDARFDPDNLSGPYVTTQGLQTITRVIGPADLGSGAASSTAPDGTASGNSITGTVTLPTNLNGATIAVACWAGGGGGGSGSNITQAAAGGGGGGGEYAAEQALAVTPGATYVITIGQGGSGDKSQSRVGSDGGDTTFQGDAVLVRAHGGKLGGHGTATGSGGSTGQFQGAGGAGGSGSTNSSSGPGGPGGPGGQNNSGTAASGGGGGGSGGPGATGQTGSTGDGKNPTPGAPAVAQGGPGGTGGAPKRNGSAPAAPPGGGGGAGSGENDGGNGAPGQIMLTYTVLVPATARTLVIPEVPIRVIAGYARNATASFEGGLGTWAPQNAAEIVADTTYSLWGQTSCKLNPGWQVNPAMISEPIVTGPATVVSGSAWIYSPVSYPASLELDILFANASGTVIGTVPGSVLTPAASTWTQLTNYQAPVPAGTVTFRLRIQVNGTPSQFAPIWVDQIAGAPGPAAGMFPLFTGYTDSWADTGIVNPTDPGGPQTGPFAGYAETNLTATDAFEPLALATLPQLSVPVGSGSDAGSMIAAVLQAVGWPSGQQLIDTSPVLLQGSDYGDNALDLMQAAATTDGGDLFVDGLGNVVFFTRNHVLSATTSTTPQAVFGDRPGTVQPNGTELPYAAITRVSDNTTLFNDIQITPVSGVDPAVPSSTTAEAFDPSAIAQFLFIRTYSNSSTLQLNQSDALLLAEWILFIAKDSEDRVDSLLIDPQRDPGDLYFQVLGRGFTDRIELWRRPAGMISPVTRPLGIRGITHTFDFSARTWQTTWQLQDFTKYASFLRLDDINSGRLGYNALAWS